MTSTGVSWGSIPLAHSPAVLIKGRGASEALHNDAPGS